MRRPSDTETRIFFTYLVPGDDRLRLDIALHTLASVSTLLGNVHSKATWAPMTFCKRIHRYTHAPEDELRHICHDAGILTPQLDEAIREVSAACEICAKNGRPKHSRKVSLTHVNEAFNEEIQMDFMVVHLHGKRHIVFLMTDTGTGYAELEIVMDRSALTFTNRVETTWICRHGAPQAVSSDDKYNRRPVLNCLQSHNVKFKPRPSRCHNKTGKVERKIQTITTILDRLHDEISNAAPTTLVEPAGFLANMFSGSRILSSFELVRGYSPSIVCIPGRMIPQDLFHAHREQAAVRALQRILTSHAPNSLQADMFQPGEPVWVYYRSRKNNERNKWVKATVVRAQEHLLFARRSSKEPPMRIAYEDVRIAPKGALTTELLHCALEEELVQAEPCTNGTDSPGLPLCMAQTSTQALDSCSKGGKVSDGDQDISNSHRKALLASKTLGRRQDVTSDIGDYANTVTANNPQT